MKRFEIKIRIEASSGGDVLETDVIFLPPSETDSQIAIHLQRIVEKVAKTAISRLLKMAILPPPGPTF
jgi:hypothetical protein